MSDAGDEGKNVHPQGLYLRLFGPPALEGAGGAGVFTGAPSRRRSLALLAMVASAGPDGIPRDRLLLHLWPESDQERARNSLKQTVFELRRSVHSGVLVWTTTALRLNPSMVRCDLWDFEAALEAGRLEDAVAAHRGRFLEGLSLTGLLELDRWIDSERRAHALRFGEALRALAAQADAAGNVKQATTWLKRAVQSNPLDSDATLALMTAHAKEGDRIGALELGRRHAQAVREELRTGPDSRIAALAEQLRNELAQPGSSASLADPAPSAPSDRAQQAQRRRLLRVVGVSAALVVVAVAASLLVGRSSRATPVASDSVVAVLPFRFVGDSPVAYLGEGMQTVLGEALDGAGSLRVVPGTVLSALGQRRADRPDDSFAAARRVARAAGAGRFVVGEVIKTGGGAIQISAAVYGVRGGSEPVSRASAAGVSDAFLVLAQQVARELIAGLHPGEQQRLTRTAVRSAETLAALKAYLRGEDLLRSGRYADAADELRRATGLDSTYALAYYRLSTAAEWAGWPALARAAAESALRHGNRLTERDRQLVAAQVAWNHGRSVDAERILSAVVADYPQDLEAWFALGEVLFHSNPLHGRSAVEARSAFENVLAIEPTNGEALVHLARIAAIQGRTRDMNALLRRALRVTPDSTLLELRSFRAFALGDRPGEKSVTRGLLAAPTRLSGPTALQLASRPDDTEGQASFARSLADPSNPRDVRAHGLRMLAEVSVAQGRWSAATEALAVAQRLDTAAALELRSLFVALPILARPAAELIAARDEVAAWDATDRPGRPAHTEAHRELHRLIRLHRLGVLSAALRDGAALGYADSLERVSDPHLVRQSRTLAHSIRAHVAAAANRPADALRELEAAAWEGSAEVFVAEAFDRLLRADLLSQLGRDDEALGWYSSIAERASYELVYMAPAALMQGRIYERRGNRSEAATHYRRFLQLWADPDPSFRTLRSEVRAALARLN